MVHMTTSTRLAEVVAAEINAAGLSLREAAERTGIARTTLTRRQRLGDYTVLELELIAGLLGTTVVSLLQAAEAAA